MLRFILGMVALSSMINKWSIQNLLRDINDLIEKNVLKKSDALERSKL